MDWGVSAVSLIIVVLTTWKWRYAPICGVVGQVFWFVYALSTKQYGLIPCVIGFTVVYLMAIPKWLREGR